MEVMRCVRELSDYLNRHQDGEDTAEVEYIRTIIRILIRYVEVYTRYRVNPILPETIILLRTHVEYLRHALPVNIIMSIETAIDVIQNDAMNTDAMDTHHTGMHHLHSANMHYGNMPNMFVRHPNMHHERHTRMHHNNMFERHTSMHHVSNEPSSGGDTCKISVEDADKYENLRRGADRIKQKLTELESVPNTNPEHVSNLVNHLVNIMKYTSDIEMKYGGGASKF
jgi:hypothetical protein